MNTLNSVLATHAGPRGEVLLLIHRKKNVERHLYKWFRKRGKHLLLQSEGSSLVKRSVPCANKLNQTLALWVGKFQEFTMAWCKTDDEEMNSFVYDELLLRYFFSAERQMELLSCVPSSMRLAFHLRPVIERILAVICMPLDNEFAIKDPSQYIMDVLISCMDNYGDMEWEDNIPILLPALHTMNTKSRGLIIETIRRTLFVLFSMANASLRSQIMNIENVTGITSILGEQIQDFSFRRHSVHMSLLKGLVGLGKDVAQRNVFVLWCIHNATTLGIINIFGKKKNCPVPYAFSSDPAQSLVEHVVNHRSIDVLYRFLLLINRQSLHLKAIIELHLMGVNSFYERYNGLPFLCLSSETDLPPLYRDLAREIKKIKRDLHEGLNVATTVNKWLRKKAKYGSQEFIYDVFTKEKRTLANVV